MNAAARELAIIGHAKSREPVLTKARQIRAELRLPPSPALNPTLVLGWGDRL